VFRDPILRDPGKPRPVESRLNYQVAAQLPLTLDMSELDGNEHIAIQEKLDGGPVDWLEHVTAEQYEGRADAG
jgi:hypothetical protein